MALYGSVKRQRTDNRSEFTGSLNNRYSHKKKKDNIFQHFILHKRTAQQNGHGEHIKNLSY